MIKMDMSVVSTVFWRCCLSIQLRHLLLSFVNRDQLQVFLPG